MYFNIFNTVSYSINNNQESTKTTSKTILSSIVPKSQNKKVTNVL